MMPVFEGDDVTLQCRMRFGMGAPTSQVKLPNWRKLKKRDLYPVFKAMEDEVSARRPIDSSGGSVYTT